MNIEKQDNLSDKEKIDYVYNAVQEMQQDIYVIKNSIEQLAEAVIKNEKSSKSNIRKLINTLCKSSDSINEFLLQTGKISIDNNHNVKK